MTQVYWIFNSDCHDITKDGYVGVSTSAEMRFTQHKKRSKRFPANIEYRVIFEGTREECFNLEKELRPLPGIGWNMAVGGKHGWRIAFKHSDETTQKLKDAWTDERRQVASMFKAIQNKKLKGQKRPKQSIAMQGENNPMYGTTRPDYVKLAVSLSRKGKPPSNKLELYCIHCRKRAPLSTLKKYHGIGKINCVL